MGSETDTDGLFRAEHPDNPTPEQTSGDFADWLAGVLADRGLIAEHVGAATGGEIYNVLDHSRCYMFTVTISVTE